MSSGMIIGRWYEIRHRSESQRYDRMSVMQYLGEDDRPGPVTHLFNARPVAGTQTLPDSWLISLEEVPATTKPVIGTRWHPDESARAIHRQPRGMRS